ncbi:MAG: class I adenylate-forming enzyme family protein [Betaproteobacteria bacterium]
MNITDPMRSRARERPDAVAIVRPRGASVSWRDFDRIIDGVAGRCLDGGIRPGDLVLLAIQRPFRLLVLELALARLGAAAVSSALPGGLASACLVEVAGDASMHPNTHEVKADWFEPPSAAPAPVPSHRDGDAIAIVCPSSGTTGIPKAIPITHAHLAARVAAADAGVPLPATPRQVCLPGASSGYGFVSILRVLWAGGTHVIATTAEEIVAMIPRHGVQRLVMMPFWVERIVEALPPQGRLAPLEQVEVGGAILPGPLLRIARERLCAHVVSVYGATEAGCIAMGAFDDLDFQNGEVGRALPGVEIAAFDEQGHPLPAGADGVLRVRGRMCSGHYLGNAEASAGAFADGWLVTPDLGRVADDGTVTLAGRLGDLISIGGYRIRPSVVEEALLSLDAVEDAAAFGASGASGAMQLCAAIVTRAPIEQSTLHAALQARIPGIVPSFVMRVDEVPRNAGGKILRNELVSLALASGLRER